MGWGMVVEGNGLRIGGCGGIGAIKKILDHFWRILVNLHQLSQHLTIFSESRPPVPTSHPPPHPLHNMFHWSHFRSRDTNSDNWSHFRPRDTNSGNFTHQLQHSRHLTPSHHFKTSSAVTKPSSQHSKRMHQRNLGLTLPSPPMLSANSTLTMID